MANDLDYQGPNPNTESPHGKYSSKIPNWIKEQAVKGNKRFEHLRDSV